MNNLPFEAEMKANAKAWNEVTPIHQRYRSSQHLFFEQGGCQLDAIERQNLPDVKGMHVAHLCCNCGQDTLSLANLGALCTGFDLSSDAVRQARDLSEASGVSAGFVECNVLSIPETYHQQFDLVYISRGALVWLPDLKLLMKNASCLLRPGGQLFLYDRHPFAFMLDHLTGESQLTVVSDYFRQYPKQRYGLDYIGDTEYEASPNYQFMVRIADVLNGISENGMRLVKFLEFEHSANRHFDQMEQREDGLYYFPEGAGIPRVPVMMLVQAVKE